MSRQRSGAGFLVKLALAFLFLPVFVVMMVAVGVLGLPKTGTDSH